MDAKRRLHALIDELSDDDAEELFDAILEFRRFQARRTATRREQEQPPAPPGPPFRGIHGH